MMKPMAPRMLPKNTQTMNATIIHPTTLARIDRPAELLIPPGYASHCQRRVATGRSTVCDANQSVLVIAPVSAPCTRRAYLPSTPVV